MRPYVGLHSCQTMKMNRRHSEQCSLQALSLASVWTWFWHYLKSKTPSFAFAGIVFHTNSLLKDFQKLLLDTKPGGYLSKQKKTKGGSWREEKKEIFFCQTDGIGSYPKSKMVMALSNTRDLKIIASALDIFVCFIFLSLEIQTKL